MNDPTTSFRAAEGDGAGADSQDLTSAVAGARSGLRSAVQVLVDGMSEGQLFVPLAQPIQDVVPGVQVEVSDSLKLTPHLLVDAEDLRYVALFTQPSFLEDVAARMEWQTAGGPLEYCALPAVVALDMASTLVDEKNVVGVFLNPMDDDELFLQRHELASVLQSKAIPLVGYVSQIPFDPTEKMLVSELDAPIAADIVAAIDETISKSGVALSYVLRQTFNAERDVEPHLTLNLLTEELEGNLVPLAKALAENLEGLLPPPGYIDILFNDPTLR